MSVKPKNNDLKMPEFNNSVDILVHEIRAILPIIQNKEFSAPRVIYPEERFRKYFAPFLLGFHKVPEGENLQACWISEVGSLHTEVDIVDNSNNILFVVPPFINLESINLSVSGTAKTRFASINQIYDEDSRNFPAKARLEYYQNLGRKLGSVFQDIRTDPEHVEKWLKIFQFYNVDPKVMFLAQNNLNQNNVNRPYNTSEAPSAGSSWSNIPKLDFNPSFD